MLPQVTTSSNIVVVVQTWFKVTVSAGNSASTETDRSRRLEAERYAQNTA